MNLKNLSVQYYIVFFCVLLSLYTSPLSANELPQTYRHALNLSNEEVHYLDSHPVLRVQSEYDYPPFNFIKNGKPIGYSIDYVNLLSEILKVEINVGAGKSWS